MKIKKIKDFKICAESSTSHPGGNQVDGLPPASSAKARKRKLSDLAWLRCAGFGHEQVIAPAQSFCSVSAELY